MNKKKYWLDWLLDSGVNVFCDDKKVVHQIRAAEHADENSTFVRIQDQLSPVNDLEKPYTKSGATHLLSSTVEIAAQSRKLLSNMSSLSEVKDYLLKFQGCALIKTATTTVFGTGNPLAKILIIGEGPGEEEDLTGEPFVGRAGKLLTSALKSINLSVKENVFITNSVFWRPPGNRNPSEDELAICRPFLDAIIRIIAPKLIITLGKVAVNSLLLEQSSLGKVRGKCYNVNKILTGAQLIALYHPAYLLRNPRQKKLFWTDLLMVKQKIIELEL